MDNAPTSAHSGPVLGPLTLTTGVVREYTVVRSRAPALRTGWSSSSSRVWALRLGKSKSSRASLRMGNLLNRHDGKVMQSINRQNCALIDHKQ
ncbi:hypothetical protein D3C80_772850 [compost metagenome]